LTFPKPVYRFMGRPKNGAFVANHPKYGTHRNTIDLSDSSGEPKRTAGNGPGWRCGMRREWRVREPVLAAVVSDQVATIRPDSVSAVWIATPHAAMCLLPPESTI
jgi:hypothetical protein